MNDYYVPQEWSRSSFRSFPIQFNRKGGANDGILTLQMRRFYTLRNEELPRQVVTEPKCLTCVGPSLRLTRSYSSHAAGTYVDMDFCRPQAGILLILIIL